MEIEYKYQRSAIFWNVVDYKDAGKAGMPSDGSLVIVAEMDLRYECSFIDGKFIDRFGKTREPEYWTHFPLTPYTNKSRKKDYGFIEDEKD